MATRGRRPRGGVALALILLLLPVLALLGLTLSSGNVQTLRDVELTEFSSQAENAADGGLQAAMLQLKNDPSWSAGFGTTALPTMGAFTYAVTVTNNLNGGSAVTAVDGTPVPPGMVFVRSTGTGSAGITRTLAALLRVGGYFSDALFSVKGLSIGGTSRIDGWDSRTDTFLTNAALVQTNAPQISVLQGTVDGGLLLGPGGSASSPVLRGNGTYNSVAVSGQLRQPLSLPLPGEPYPTADYPSGAVDGQRLDNIQSDLTLPPNYVYHSGVAVKSATLTLVSGTYYIDGDLSLMNSNSTIHVVNSSGPVVIYLTGAFEAGGGSLANDSRVPANFQVYGVAANANPFTVRGGPGAYAVIYSWNSDATIYGNSNLYGTVMAQSITTNGTTAIHYDRELGRLAPSGAGLQVAAFERL